MGQDVVIRETVTVGDVLMVDTDRSFTGQDGHVITLESERLGVPGKLADGLFALDLGIDYVYVLQNSVTVRRDGGWDDDSAAKVAEVTGSFLRFYPDTEDVAGEPSSEDVAGEPSSEEEE